MKTVWVFDLDDTLYPESQYVLSGFRAVDRWLKKNWTNPGFFQVAAKLFHDGRRGRIFNEALDMLGVPYSNENIEQLVAVYRNHEPQIDLFPDAQTLLTDLLKKDQLGLLTDGYLVSQKMKIAALQLENNFHTIVCSDAFGRENWKPSLVPYKKIMESFSDAGRTFVYVGDNPHKDFYAAKKLGWGTIMVQREGSIHGGTNVSEEYMADSVIGNLSELSNISVV